MSRSRVGIYGGTFNPPHLGHIQSARAFITEMKLDKLIIIPAFIPPHKEYDINISCIDRFEMCKIAFDGIDKTYVSDIEIAREGKSYTYLTLQELSSSDKELFMLCGSDMITSMDNWKNPEIIFNLAHICYVRREKEVKTGELIKRKCSEYMERYGARISFIDSHVIDISSSRIRRDPICYDKYVPEAVKEYIEARGLYK